MRSHVTHLLVFLALLTAPRPCHAWEEPRVDSTSAARRVYDLEDDGFLHLPRPGTDYHWLSQAAATGLASQDVEQLAKDKTIVGGETYKQVFTPYIEQGALPVFITSDSLLNAFNVLYAESVCRIEQANAATLHRVLSAIWQNIDAVEISVEGRADLAASSKKHARIVIGTALTLLGDTAFRPSAEDAATIDAEAAKVTEATANVAPEWMGGAQDSLLSIDYSRYKPRGFYTRSEKLQRYFRATNWLQSIPFRVSDDKELLAILVIGDGIGRDASERFFRQYEEFIGIADDMDAVDANETLGGAAPHRIDTALLAKARKELTAKAATQRRPLVNDQNRLPPGDASVVAEANLRVISAYRTPDAVIFQETTDLRKFSRPFPTGLEVAVALGSTVAPELINEPEKEEVLRTIAANASAFSGSSLYGMYLGCLRALLDKPDTRAPAFMSGKAWQTKSCQTTLAGWAQMRHTWALQAKQNVKYLAASMPPPGVIEPEPEFFARMARLAERTQDLLRQNGALEVDYGETISQLRTAARLLRSLDWSDDTPKGTNRRSDTTRQAVTSVFDVVLRLDMKGLNIWEKEYSTTLAGKLEEIAAGLDRGKLPDDARLADALRGLAADIAPLWRKLHDLSERLALLAEKELAGEAFSKDDEWFIRGYGLSIAKVMLYFSDAYLNPTDDAPRAVDVFSNPLLGEYLEIGVARPRALYVLYPWNDGEMLCRGAVMPYYEFRSPSRLTDDQWRQMLDGEARPQPPDWMSTITWKGGILAPVRE